ncbi:MAG: hypothetical protein Q4A11_03755 [Brachymonas sp.]|nr:hypothetical protein [Brachymonas sp.]
MQLIGSLESLTEVWGLFLKSGNQLGSLLKSNNAHTYAARPRKAHDAMLQGLIDCLIDQQFDSIATAVPVTHKHLSLAH